MPTCLTCVGGGAVIYVCVILPKCRVHVSPRCDASSWLNLWHEFSLTHFSAGRHATSELAIHRLSIMLCPRSIMLCPRLGLHAVSSCAKMHDSHHMHACIAPALRLGTPLRYMMYTCEGMMHL